MPYRFCSLLPAVVLQIAQPEAEHLCRPTGVQKSPLICERRRLSGTEYAELVVVGVGHDYPVDVALADVDPGRSEFNEAIDLGSLIDVSEIVPYVVTDNAFINDGIALDAEGRVYVTDVITNGMVRVEPDGTVVPIAGGAEQGFDGPTNMAFGVGATESTMYVVNLAGGSYEPNDLSSRALIAIDVDTPGMPLP